MKTEFKEQQKFTQWWLWMILAVIGIINILGIYKQLILGEKFGSKQMPNNGLIITSLFIFSLITLFWMIQLKTEIDQNEIRINFFPLFKKRVNWKDVKSTKIVNYGFVGYGIRLGSKYGIVYNINGRKGLAIELQNGKKFVIGTQKGNELDKIVKTINNQNDIY